MGKTIAIRFKESLLANDDVAFQAHGALSAGDTVLIVVATGVSEAAGAGTTAKLNAVVISDVASGAIGHARIMPNATAATAVGSLL